MMKSGEEHVLGRRAWSCWIRYVLPLLLMPCRWHWCVRPTAGPGNQGRHCGSPKLDKADRRWTQHGRAFAAICRGRCVRGSNLMCKKRRQQSFWHHLPLLLCPHSLRWP